MRTLIVEANKIFGELVVQWLKSSGIDSDVASTVANAERALADFKYAAVILDLALPDRNGLDLLRDLRARGVSTPVLITSARHGLDDRRLALREGADDYLAKPFSIDELVDRLQATLRRPRDLGGMILRAGNVSLSTRSRQVSVQAEVHEVRPRQTLMLELLMRQLGQVVPRGYLFDQLFGSKDEQTLGAVDVYVHRLRRKLADAGATVTIHTVRGVGYMLTEINAGGGREPALGAAQCPR